MVNSIIINLERNQPFSTTTRSLGAQQDPRYPVIRTNVTALQIIHRLVVFIQSKLFSDGVYIMNTFDWLNGGCACNIVVIDHSYIQQINEIK